MQSWTCGQFIQRAIGPVLIAVCAQLAFSGIAHSQAKLVPQGSIGKVRTVVSLAVSRKLNSKNIRSIPASLTNISAPSALELIQSRVPSLNRKWAGALNTALKSEGTTATVVRSQGGMYLAVSWRRGLLQKVGIRTVGALVDLGAADGGIPARSSSRLGISKGSLGGLCNGCDWTWGGDCTTCSESVPQPNRTDYQPIRSLPEGRETKISLFVLPKRMLSSVQCADEQTALAMLTNEGANE